MGLTRLLFPLQYFLIQNRTKFVLDLVPALILAVAATGLTYLAGSTNFFGSGGVINNLMGLTAALTGFYVAALTAAATFQNPDLDHKIENGALTLFGEKLSRRQWVCHMFGYLAFSAMAFTVLAALSVPSAQAMQVRGVEVPAWLGVAVRFAVLWWVAHLFVVTNLGLYYLVERLSDKTPKVTTRKSDLNA